MAARHRSHHRDLVVSSGAMLHHLDVALTGIGVRTQVHRLPDPSRPDHLAALTLSAGALDEEAVRQTSTIERRRSDRRPFVDLPVPAPALQVLTDVAADRAVLLLWPLDRTLGARVARGGHARPAGRPRRPAGARSVDRSDRGAACPQLLVRLGWRRPSASLLASARRSVGET